MASSLSKLVDNLSEGIHNNKCSDCGSNLDYIKIEAERSTGPSSLERKNEKLILECYKQRYKKNLIKNQLKDSLVHIVFVIMILINSCYC